jgi:hypothetical protein
MGHSLDIVQTYLDKAWANPPASVFESEEIYFSDDFKNLDIEGNVTMDRATYIGMGKMLFASFSGFDWVPAGLREEGGDVYMTGHFEGTFTGDLDLSAMGVGIIPASGKKIVWPETTVRMKVEGNKIASLQETDDNGGMGVFLKLLGVEMPSS